MSAIGTNLPASQLNLNGAGVHSGYGPMNAYVAPAHTPGVTSAYQKRPVNTPNYPDAFVDRALIIRDNTEEATWVSQSRWQTRVALPLKITNEIVVRVDHFEALPTFFSVTPEQAVAHMLTQTSTSEEIHLVRWSLQARLEHNWMKTPIGQERYEAMLNQFSTSMNETACAEVARALLQATDAQQTWLQRHGQITVDELMNFLRWDVFVFGALQKFALNPLEKINQRVTSMMTAYHGRADTIIMSEDLQIYAQLVPINKTVYAYGGQDAIDNVAGRGKGRDSNTPTDLESIEPVRWIGKNRIYIHRSFVVEGQGDVDPWHRTRQIGEWNILEDTVRRYAKYRTDQRTIFIYNQDRDTMSPITLKDGIMYSQMWEEDGTLKNLGVNGTVDPLYNRDARFYPFAVEANSYAAIKFCGDISQRHFDMGDANNLAETMLNSAYRDDTATTKANELDVVVRLLNEANSRLLRETGKAGAGNVLYKVGENGIFAGQDEMTTFESFATRMKGIMPNSIFLDPTLSLTGETAGATLWETLVYSNARPVYENNGEVRKRQELAFEMLIASMGALVREDAQTEWEKKRAAAVTNNDTSDAQAAELAGFVRENYDPMKFAGIVQVNAWLEEQFKQYRNYPKDDMVQTGDGNVVGYVSRARRDTAENADQAAGEDTAQVNLGSRVQHSMTPTSAIGIPMFAAIAADIGASMSSGGSRRTQVAQDRGEYGDSFGGVTAPIASYMEDEEFFQDRRRELGHQLNALEGIGLGGLTTQQVRAALGVMASNLDALSKAGMSLQRKLMVIIYYGLPFTRESLCSLCDNDIVVPVTIIVARPHITVETRIIVKCLSGGGSGYLYYANANVSVGDNVLTGTHTINMHFYMRGHVHTPRNVFVIPDVFVMGYHGGMGVRPILGPDMYTPAEMTVDGPCAFYFMCGYKTTRETVPNPFDISGHHNSSYRLSGPPTATAPAYDSVAMYAPMYGFGNTRTGYSDLPALREHHVETRMYRGHQEEDDGNNGYTRIEPNTGHWGPTATYKGAKAAREGEHVVLRAPGANLLY